KVSHAQYIEQLRDKIKEEIADGDYQRIIVSNEHCHSRLRAPEAVERLISLFGSGVTSVAVILYLRRQDRMAVSLHSTRTKLGGSGEVFPVAEIGRLPHYFRFDFLTEMYAT